MSPFNEIVARAPLFLLVAVRIFAIILTTPLLSIQSVPRVAKVALAGLVAFIVMPQAYPAGWNVDSFSLNYALLVVGEGLIGAMTGFFISMVPFEHGPEYKGGKERREGIYFTFHSTEPE